MGCTSSKIAVQPHTSDAWTNKPISKKGRPNSNLVKVKSKAIADVDITRDHPPQTEIVLQKNCINSSKDLINDPPGNRDVSSATSKTSSHTFDSGLESDYGHVITENCHPHLVDSITEDQRPPTPKLYISGKQIDSRKRSGGRRTQESADILAELRSQGIVTRPTSKLRGMAFDIMLAPEDELSRVARPPPRLAKLKKRKKKTKKTKEDIEANMLAVEARRKIKEAEMIERLNTSKKEIHVQTTLDESERSQKKQVEIKMSNALDKAAENRKVRMLALKEKLIQKQRHAEKVRQAKLERMQDGTNESQTTSEV